jgi:hypothetical protein
VAYIESRAVSDKADYLRALTTETLPSVSVYKLHEIADYIEQMEREGREAARAMLQATIELRKMIDEVRKLR